MTDDQRPESASRRRFLKRAGAVGVTGAAGVGGWAVFWPTDGTPGADQPTESLTDGLTDASPTVGTASDPHSPYADRFDTVVDVAERGGDTGGERPINDILESNLADDTLFYFLEGTYLVTDLFAIQHHDNVGFVGPDATLKPAAGQIGDWLIASDVSRLLLDGITLSNAAERTAVRTKVHVSGGENVIRDVSVTGFHDVSTRTHGLTIQVNGADSVLRLENVDLTDGGQNGTGVFVHPAPVPGTLRLENCRIANWYEQGLYGSSHGGPMAVIGGRYENNGKAQVRVGGGAADTEAVVRGVTVRVTDPQPAEAKGGVWGIWLHEGERTLVENCDVAVTNLSVAGSSGAVVLGAEQGTTTIRDTTIRVDAPTFAIAATSPKDEGFVLPSMEHPPENWELTVENVSITGTAERDVGVWIVDRPGCRLRDLTIDQSGGNRDGIGLLRSPGAEITVLSCSTPGFAVLTDVPRDVRDCLVSLAEIETIERVTHREDGASDAAVSNASTPVATSTGESVTGDSRGQAGEVTTVRPTNGEFCLYPSDFDASDERPVLGVIELDSGELSVRLVSQSVLIPY